MSAWQYLNYSAILQSFIAIWRYTVSMRKTLNSGAVQKRRLLWDWPFYVRDHYNLPSFKAAHLCTPAGADLSLSHHLLALSCNLNQRVFQTKRILTRLY